MSTVEMEIDKNTPETTSINLTDDGGVTKQIITEGTGPKPNNGVEVSVHYTGKLDDGTVFDSSRESGNAFKFTLGEGSVIKGWDIGVKTMSKGERSRITCQSSYAYGENGSGEKIPPNSTLTFDIELIDWEFESITSDKSITKQLIIDGNGFEKPNEGAVCKVKFTGSVLGSGVVFCEEEKEVVVGETDNVPIGFGKCLENMKKEEKSEFYIKPGMNHFEQGFLPENVLEGDSLKYEIEMIEFEKQKESWSMSTSEKLEFALKSKSKGNDYFKQNRIRDAKMRYEMVISYLDFTDEEEISEEQKLTKNELLVASHNNLSGIFIKTKEFSKAIENCSKALEIDSKNTKALYRKSYANMNNGETDLALDDIKNAIKIDSGNKAFLQQYHKLKLKIKEDNNKKREMYQRMFAKGEK